LIEGDGVRKTIQYQMPQYVPVPDQFQTNTIRQFRGVNKYDSFMIDDGFFTETQNLVSDTFPTSEVRPGYSVLGSAIGTRVTGLGVWKNQRLVANFNDGTMRYWTGSAWTTIASGLSTSSAPWSYCNFQGNLADINLICTNGVDPVKKYDGTTLSNLATAPAGGNFVTVYQNRVWLAVGKEVHSCALDQPEQWALFNGDDEDSYVKDMESTAGENVNMLNGGLYRLTIGMPSSVHLLFGGLPSDFNTRLITEDEGFASNSAVITQQGTMRFMHKTGLYEYEASTNPDASFSDIIRPYYSQVTSNSVAGTNGQRLYFFIEPDIILYHDPRAGIKTWFEWKGIRATCFALMNNQLYIGDDQGRVLLLGGSTSDNGTLISYKAVTKPFTAPSMNQQSRWIKAWVTVELAAGTTFNVSVSPSASGDSDWTLMQTITGTGDIAKQRVVVPLTTFNFAEYVRFKFDGNGWMRLHEISFQHRVNPLY
jgi:hypothetical protein